MKLVIRPNTITNAGTRYDTFCNGRLLCTSRTPFLSAARVLQEQGFPPNLMISLWHEGSAHPSLRATIGQAAGLTVRETSKDGPVLVAYIPRLHELKAPPRAA
jgi:hypothetical protein